MNKYSVQYSVNGVWVPFQILSDSIYEVESWVKANIQERGIHIALINESPIQPEETFGMWSDRAYKQRQQRAAYQQAIANKG